MKKMAGVYSILLGVSIMGLWSMLLSTGNVPELKTALISIAFHMAAETIMGILLLMSGVALIKDSKNGVSLFVLSNGLVIYSVVNSAGYYGEKGQWIMVAMFMAILFMSSFLTYGLLKKAEL